MPIDRRSALSGIATLGISGAAVVVPGPRAQPVVAASEAAPNGVSRKQLPYVGRPPLARERAAEVLARLGLDGLLIGDPVDVYYLTGFDSTIFSRSLKVEPGVFAVLPRDARRPVGMVMPAAGYYNGFAAIHEPWNLAVFQHGPEGTMYPDRGQEPLDGLERTRGARSAGQRAAHGVAANEAEAVGRAVRELGLAGARLGIDAEPGTRRWSALQQALGDARLQPSHEALARMRLVKSPAEVALMRYAARANAEAARLACGAVREGASHRDLRALFFTESARRGGQGAWINIDRVAADAYRGEFRRGQAFMIDAVSLYDGYHGDYGRTVFVGEPRKSMRRHVAAIELAWRAVRERLRPGLRFSQIVEIGQSALKQGGFDTGVRITPHSIGILHTDATGLGDIELEKDMVLSVDFPVLDGGIGGSAHLEDLTLITADGCELLNEAVDPVIEV